MLIEKIIKKNYDLTSLTTFRIGGRAEFFVAIKNKRELTQAINWARAKKLPTSFLGGGSNILITSRKIRGLVIKIGGENYSITGNIVSSWSGTGLTRLAKITYNHGLSGLEWALGIPGSIGGAVRGNAGAYGSDISRNVAQVEAYDIAKNRLITLKLRACDFAYRDSVFKQNNNLIIVNVKLALTKGNTEEIKRQAKNNFHQRLANHPKEPSAGCVFKNLEYAKIAEQNKKLAEKLLAEGLFRGNKIGAAYFIDQLGLKSEVRGGARISEKHANFIINAGGAKARDVISLISFIRKKVKEKYKINLEEEVQYFGN
ncbi:MAG: UDP-N-acetylmuramate dehydrogenase [Patescibacteria group bacterium]|nr:UDP-N-acetylmuramate dehydrogenase [Patescibacteria group bacterium]